jgi:methylase of polypeptide subunit release factors
MAEPRIAIFGGPDGLDIYRKLFAQLRRFTWQPKYIFTESLPPQHEKLAQIAHQNGFKLGRSEDFIQVFKPQ